MPDEIQNGQESVEQTPPEAVSTSNETQETESGLPDDASDRTKEQFEKLKQHNKELSDRLKALETQEKQPEYNPFDITGGGSRTDVPRVELPSIPGLNKTQVNDVYDKLVDENGYIDHEELKRALKEAKEAAEKATFEAKLAREELDKRTEGEQVRVTHKEFPQLDPKSPEFNEKFFNAVRNEMVSQIIRGEKDYMAAAKKVSSWFPVQKKEEVAAKKQEQAHVSTFTGTSQGRPQPKSGESSDLARRMWKGDRSALLERLNKSGF